MDYSESCNTFPRRRGRQMLTSTPLKTGEDIGASVPSAPDSSDSLTAELHHQHPDHIAAGLFAKYGALLAESRSPVRAHHGSHSDLLSPAARHGPHNTFLPIHAAASQPLLESPRHAAMMTSHRYSPTQHGGFPHHKPMTSHRYSPPPVGGFPMTSHVETASVTSSGYNTRPTTPTSSVDEAMEMREFSNDFGMADSPLHIRDLGSRTGSLPRMVPPASMPAQTGSVEQLPSASLTSSMGSSSSCSQPSLQASVKEQWWNQMSSADLPAPVRRRLMQQRFLALKAKTEQLKVKDERMKAKFAELQRQRELLNSPAPKSGWMSPKLKALSFNKRDEYRRSRGKGSFRRLSGLMKLGPPPPQSPAAKISSKRQTSWTFQSFKQPGLPQTPRQTPARLDDKAASPIIYDDLTNPLEKSVMNEVIKQATVVKSPETPEPDNESQPMDTEDMDFQPLLIDPPSPFKQSQDNSQTSDTPLKMSDLVNPSFIPSPQDPDLPSPPASLSVSQGSHSPAPSMSVSLSSSFSRADWCRRSSRRLSNLSPAVRLSAVSHFSRRSSRRRSRSAIRSSRRAQFSCRGRPSQRPEHSSAPAVRRRARRSLALGSPAPDSPSTNDDQLERYLNDETYSVPTSCLAAPLCAGRSAKTRRKSSIMRSRREGKRKAVREHSFASPKKSPKKALRDSPRKAVKTVVLKSPPKMKSPSSLVKEKKAGLFQLRSTTWKNLNAVSPLMGEKRPKHRAKTPNRMSRFISKLGKQLKKTVSLGGGETHLYQPDAAPAQTPADDATPCHRSSEFPEYHVQCGSGGCQITAYAEQAQGQGQRKIVIDLRDVLQEQEHFREMSVDVPAVGQGHREVHVDRSRSCVERSRGQHVARSNSHVQSSKSRLFLAQKQAWVQGTPAADDSHVTSLSSSLRSLGGAKKKSQC